MICISLRQLGASFIPILILTGTARAVPLDLSGDPGAYYDVVGDGKTHPLVTGTCDISGASIVRVGEQVRLRAVVAQSLTSVMMLHFSLDTDQDHATAGDYSLWFEGMVTHWNIGFWSPANGARYISIPLIFYDNGLEAFLPLDMLGGDDGWMDYRVASSLYIPAYNAWTGVLDYLPDSGRVTSYVPEPAALSFVLLGGALASRRARKEAA